MPPLRNATPDFNAAAEHFASVCARAAGDAAAGIDSPPAAAEDPRRPVARSSSPPPAAIPQGEPVSNNTTGNVSNNTRDARVASSNNTRVSNKSSNIPDGGNTGARFATIISPSLVAAVREQMQAATLIATADGVAGSDAPRDGADGSPPDLLDRRLAPGPHLLQEQRRVASFSTDASSRSSNGMRAASSSDTVVQLAGNIEASIPPPAVGTSDGSAASKVARQPDGVAAQDVRVKIIQQAVPRKYIGDWVLGKTIGEGSSGKVKLAENPKTGEFCVVKAVRRPHTANGATVTETELNRLDLESLNKVYKRELYMIREASLGALLDHPNIVRLHSAVLGINHFYCFFEYVGGEDLVDYISRCGRIKERRACAIFRQIVSAVEYAHRNHVVHRDIKLENIRYDEATGVAKLLDFGFATFHTDQHMLQTNCGSPCYAAPEIYDNRAYHGPEIDVWSLGVCLFGMVTGALPFDGPTFRMLATRVRAGKVVYPSFLSDEVEHLISIMLVVTPRRRATLMEVIRHPWLNRGYSTYPMCRTEGSRFAVRVVHMDLVEKVISSGVCEAGCLLMEVMKQKLPARKKLLEEEWRQPSPARAIDAIEIQAVDRL
nr:serine/threonine-protein kinase KIN2 [Polyrhizophydium stewartii]